MITVEQIVAAQHRDIEQAQQALSARAVQSTRDALARVDRQLRRAHPGSWTQAEAVATRAQLRMGLMTLALAHQQDLAAGLPPIMRKAQQRAAQYLGALDERYLGAVRPLRFDTLAWWEQHAATLGQVRLREFGRSFQRYGADAVQAVERAISSATLTGQRWEAARREVWQATVKVVGDRQWMVDRILRTEVAAAYNGTTLAALHEEDDPADPMLKKLVATFDRVTAADSVAVHGQVRRVGEPFRDPKGRLYQAPPNRPHDREIVIGWRAAWGESIPDLAQKSALAPEVAPDLAAAASKLPEAPPLRIPRSPPQAGSAGSRLPLAKVLSQTRIGPQQASPQTPQRALLAGLTARRLVVASMLRAAMTASKVASTSSAVDPMAPRVDQLKAEYVDLRVRQAIAATGVRLDEGDLLPLARIKPGAFLDFGGMALEVARVDASGITMRTPFGPAVLPALPMPATLRTKRPALNLRPRSRLDIAALLGVVSTARNAA